jgi:DNA topoisomerase-1
MKLLIVESPAKAKTIGKYLGSDYTVVASVGHVRDLPKSSKKAIDIEGGFIPHYEISPGKEKVIASIAALARDADEIFLATDPDREGEAIAWHIKEAVKLKKPQRIVFHEITKEAVNEAVLHPRAIDQNLRIAQEARRVLDRLFGYELSGLIWKKVRYGLSAGRVQSPALRMIVEREREIRAFVPMPYWVIGATVKGSWGELAVTCTEEPTTPERAASIVEQAKKGSWIVHEIEETTVARSPRPPFTTSTLQQAASSRLGLSPARTMGIAQKLYEGGHITYMRTDSTNLSQLALTQATKTITELYGAGKAQTRTYATKSKNAQEAHEAIRPTHIEVQKIKGGSDEQRLYALIWARTVA